MVGPVLKPTKRESRSIPIVVHFRGAVFLHAKCRNSGRNSISPYQNIREERARTVEIIQRTFPAKSFRQPWPSKGFRFATQWWHLRCWRSLWTSEGMSCSFNQCLNTNYVSGMSGFHFERVCQTLKLWALQPCVWNSMTVPPSMKSNRIIARCSQWLEGEEASGQMAISWWDMDTSEIHRLQLTLSSDRSKVQRRFVEVRKSPVRSHTHWVTARPFQNKTEKSVPFPRVSFAKGVRTETSWRSPFPSKWTDILHPVPSKKVVS